MALNESAVRELFGHLVFSHEFHNFEDKERCQNLLHELVSEDKPEEKKEPAGDVQVVVAESSPEVSAS